MSLTESTLNILINECTSCEGDTISWWAWTLYEILHRIKEIGEALLLLWQFCEVFLKQVSFIEKTRAGTRAKIIALFLTGAHKRIWTGSGTGTVTVRPIWWAIATLKYSLITTAMSCLHRSVSPYLIRSSVQNIMSSNMLSVQVMYLYLFVYFHPFPPEVESAWHLLLSIFQMLWSESKMLPQSPFHFNPL